MGTPTNSVLFVILRHSLWISGMLHGCHLVYSSYTPLEVDYGKMSNFNSIPFDADAVLQEAKIMSGYVKHLQCMRIRCLFSWGLGARVTAQCVLKGTRVYRHQSLTLYSGAQFVPSQRFSPALSALTFQQGARQFSTNI